MLLLTLPKIVLNQKKKIPLKIFFGNSFLLGGKLLNDAKISHENDVWFSDLCWLAFKH